MTAGCADRVCISKFDAESWQRAVDIFSDAIRENPSFSPCYSSLVQLNNIEHLVHPGIFRDLDKAKATLELAKTAVQLDPVDSRAHLCCGWSYVFAFREADATPHMELACELNDNDPWTLLSGAHYSALCGSIEQARFWAEQSLALSPAPRHLEWGYHSTFVFFAATMPGRSRHAIARMASTSSCRRGERLPCTSLGNSLRRRKKLSDL